jgi:hypothetical protein
LAGLVITAFVDVGVAVGAGVLVAVAVAVAVAVLPPPPELPPAFVPSLLVEKSVTQYHLYGELAL